jgi:hypothetical protein
MSIELFSASEGHGLVRTTNLSPLKSVFFRCLITLCLVACGNPSPEELAALAAKGYYTHLAAGEYEKFLEGRAGAADLPEDYREQLLTACKQFMAAQQREHRGIREVLVGNARSDSVLHYTSVFLVLCYGDSTQEEIVVPMVQHNGRWLMK